MKLSKMTVEELAEEVTVLLVDGSRGIYTGEAFIMNYGEEIRGISEEDRKILIEGPHHEEYFETLDAIYDAEIQANDGRWWSVSWRDGDIVAYDDEKIRRWEDLTGHSFWDLMT